MRTITFFFAPLAATLLTSVVACSSAVDTTSGGSTHATSGTGGSGGSTGTGPGTGGSGGVDSTTVPRKLGGVDVSGGIPCFVGVSGAEVYVAGQQTIDEVPVAGGAIKLVGADPALDCSYFAMSASAGFFFGASADLRAIPLAGGASTKIATVDQLINHDALVVDPQGTRVTWQDAIGAGGASRLASVAPGGGAPQTFCSLPDGVTVQALFDDGSGTMYMAVDNQGTPSQILACTKAAGTKVLAQLEAQAPTRVVADATHVYWLDSGAAMTGLYRLSLSMGATPELFDAQADVDFNALLAAPSGIVWSNLMTGALTRLAKGASASLALAVLPSQPGALAADAKRLYILDALGGVYALEQ